jgi:hypothetical protein
LSLESRRVVDERNNLRALVIEGHSSDRADCWVESTTRRIDGSSVEGGEEISRGRVRFSLPEAREAFTEVNPFPDGNPSS